MLHTGNDKSELRQAVETALWAHMRIQNDSNVVSSHARTDRLSGKRLPESLMRGGVTLREELSSRIPTRASRVFTPPYSLMPYTYIKNSDLKFGKNGTTAPDGHAPEATADPASGALHSFFWFVHATGKVWSVSGVGVPIPSELFVEHESKYYFNVEASVERNCDAWAWKNLGDNNKYALVRAMTEVFFLPVGGEVLPMDAALRFTVTGDPSADESLSIPGVISDTGVARSKTDVYLYVVAKACVEADQQGNKHLQDHCGVGAIISAVVKQIRIW